MELILKAIENEGFEWLIRTDEEKGYFCHVHSKEYVLSNYERGISCKVYGHDKLVILTGAFGMAKSGMSN